MNLDRIPAELRELDRWVIWRWGDADPKSGKRKKPPYCPSRPSAHASSTNEATWGTFAEAHALVRADKADGIGFVLCPPYVGGDLDAELSEADKAAIVLALDSYTEHSPSGEGLHVVVKASLNGSGRHPAGLGFFQVDRFLYFTGEHLKGTPATIEERQAELEAVLERYLPKRAEPSEPREPQPVDLDDQELLDRAMRAKNSARLADLMRGDPSGYPSPSEADLAFCSMLAFWTGRDGPRIDRIFRSSGLMRPKWDEPRGETTYGGETIAKALEGGGDVYTPPRTAALPWAESRRRAQARGSRDDADRGGPHRGGHARDDRGTA